MIKIHLFLSVVSQWSANWKACLTAVDEWKECIDGYHFASYSNNTWIEDTVEKFSLNFYFDAAFYFIIITLLVGSLLKFIPWNVYLLAWSHFQSIAIVYLFSNSTEFVVYRLISALYLFSPYTIVLLPLRFVYMSYWMEQNHSELSWTSLYKNIQIPQNIVLSMLAIVPGIFVMTLLNEQARVNSKMKYSYWLFKFWKNNCTWLIISYVYLFIQVNLNIALIIISIILWVVAFITFLFSFIYFYMYELSLMCMTEQKYNKQHYQVYFKDIFT